MDRIEGVGLPPLDYGDGVEVAVIVQSPPRFVPFEAGVDVRSPRFHHLGFGFEAEGL